MSDNSGHGSDTGAAFVGLIGGVLFIGAIIFGIVIMTNKKFEGHETGGKAVSTVQATPVA